MGLKADWFDDEQTILLYTFDGQWTWDDLLVLIEQANTMTRSVRHQVDTIIDLRLNQSYPFGALMRFRSLTATAPDNWGMAVFVSENDFIGNLLATLTKVFPVIGLRYVMTDTIDAAHDIIMARRGRQSNAS